jgi:hypothetical protein
VIVDRDGVPSLIALFENINLTVSQGEQIVEVPKQTITYQHWAVFSEWKVEENEVELFGSTVQQILETQFPDGSIAPVKGKIPFIFGNAGTYRNHQDILGFPVGQEGSYHIRVWLERDDKPISEVGVREMKVIHQLQPGAKSHQIFGVSPA